MKNRIFILFSVFCLSLSLVAQKSTMSVGVDLRDSDISTENIGSLLDRSYGGNGIFTFVRVREVIDKYGVTHTDFQQCHQGIELEDCIVIAHSKAGSVMNYNGQIALAEQMVGQREVKCSKDQAVASAKRAKGITSSVSPEICRLYTRCKGNDGNEVYRLVYRMRITSLQDRTDSNVYVDVETGEVVKSMSLVNFAKDDVREVTLNTYYTGSADKRKIVVTENEEGRFELVDKARNLYFYEGKTSGTIKDNKDLMASETEEEFTANLANYLKEKVIGTAKPKSSRLSDDWDFFRLTGIHIEKANPEHNDALNKEKGNYAVMVRNCDKSKVLFRSMSNLLYGKILPIEMSLSVDLERDSTYNIALIKTLGKAPFYTDSIVFDFSYTIEGDGEFVFPGDSIDGNISIERLHNHAIDVDYAITSAYDYYLKVHDLKSFDGKGSPVHTFVDFNDDGWFGQVQNNAFAWAAEPQFIATGNGDNLKAYTDRFATLDLLAHEFTHLVIMFNGRGGMRTSGETGAINEAIPDCMAVACDFYTNGDKANWQIAEEGVMLTADNLRDVSNPKMSSGGEPAFMSFPQADTYGGEYWVDPTNMSLDNGGVHYNGGVFNYWFYLLTEGGSGTNDNGVDYAVTGIGMEKTEKLLMNVIFNYLIPAATYSDMYIATRMAAEAMYGKDSNEYTQVSNAWKAVGVDETTSAVEDVVDGASLLNVFTSDGVLMVETQEGETIEVYNSIGQLLVSQKAQSGITAINLNIENCVVIVKVGNRVEKIVL